MIRSEARQGLGQNSGFEPATPRCQVEGLKGMGVAEGGCQALAQPSLALRQGDGLDGFPHSTQLKETENVG